jgi:hypothetical protein
VPANPSAPWSLGVGKTGAAGGVLLRPFASLISEAGDSVTTYGEPWNMN